MKRWTIPVAIIFGCALASASGFWLGFREGWLVGQMADSLPRGSIATYQLDLLRAGKPNNVVVGLEFDADNGLLAGHDLFQHPLRNLLGPIWGINVFPHVEQSAVRLANYRKQHPSLMKSDQFDNLPIENVERREMAIGVRENIVKINSMVKRFASTP